MTETFSLFKLNKTHLLIFKDPSIQRAGLSLGFSKVFTRMRSLQLPLTPR